MNDIKFMVYYNQGFSSWENNNDVSAYKFSKGLKTFYKTIYQSKIVDISSRAGRITEFAELRFHGGSDYWFGPSFYDIVPKEDLLRFTACDVNEVLENEVIHIKLFDLIDYWKDENQERLRQLRVLLRVDEQK